MLVRELVNDNPYNLPEEFLELLPQYCLNPICGSPTEISEVLTGLRCVNPRCPTKITMRLLALVNSLGIMNIGKSKAEGFLKKFNIDNPALIFAYEASEDGSFDGKASMSVCKQIEEDISDKKSFTLSEYVKVCHLPHVQETATVIFDDYSSLAEAYADIESGGVDFIRNKLGIKKGATITEKRITEQAEAMYKTLCSLKGNDELVKAFVENDEYNLFIDTPLDELFDIIKSGGVDYLKDRIRLELQTRPELDVSVRALKVYNSLMTFKQDLFDALEFVDIINPKSEGIINLTVVCSTAVGSPFKSKPDFYAYINKHFADVVHINFVPSFTKKVDFTVWSGGSQFNPGVTVTGKVKSTVANNNKFQARVEAGEQPNEDGTLEDGTHYIPILNAQEFIEVLKGFREGSEIYE
jgi:hypothetical protein